MMNETISSIQLNSSSEFYPRGVDQRAKDAAQQLEATFISEMLKSAGVGKTPSTFGGGAGEDQFGSFLRDIQAREIAQSGSIGLAEQLYRSMSINDDE